MESTFSNYISSLSRHYFRRPRPSLLSPWLKVHTSQLLQESSTNDGSLPVPGATFQNVIDHVLTLPLLIIVFLQTVLQITRVFLTRVLSGVMQPLSLSHVGD